MTNKQLTRLAQSLNKLKFDKNDHNEKINTLITKLFESHVKKAG